MNTKSFRINYLSPYIIWCADSFLSAVSTLFSFMFFHYLKDIDIDSRLLFYTLLISLLSSFAWTWLCKTYEGIVRHTTVAELMRIVYAMFLKALTLLVLAFFTQEYVGLFVNTVIIADFICSVFLMMCTRALIVNFYYHILKFTDKARLNTLIYSTSEAAVSLANYLRSNNSSYNVVGFLSRNPKERHCRIVGHNVYYVKSKEYLHGLLNSAKVECMLFMNNADLHADEEVINCGLENHVSLRIAPLVEARSSLIGIQLRNVQIEDLLGREEITVNLDVIKHELEGRTIMVTGAAGSIGSELCRQLCRFNLKKLVLFDFSETATYDIDMELRKACPSAPIVSVIGDVRNRSVVSQHVSYYRPDVIFHAAAYKHVPLMEKFPCEAVQTNVIGTSIVADVAVECGVRKFIMISTDKAVRPSSVMGATKRLAEMYVQSLGEAIRQGLVKGSTSFVTTRFGNVLGSNGSVIPLFRKQILKGGPLTVTHPDIIRYFMTIPEACRLVLEAAFIGEGNDVFIFDMGQPVKIADMARRMIELAGLKPDKDIQIEYIGLRPGEKLYEELLYQKENTIPTKNPKIFRAECVHSDYNKMRAACARLLETIAAGNTVETVRMMKIVMPDYRSQNSEYESLDTAS